MSRLDRRFTTTAASMLAIAVAAGLAALPLPAAFVERWYSGRLYPLIERALTSISNLIPFALLDPLIVASVGILLVVTTRTVRQARRQKSFTPIVHGLFRLLTAAAIAYLAFLALWGLNYRRVRMIELVTLEPGVLQSDRVVALGLEAVERLNALHGQAHRTGWTTAEWRHAPLTAAAARVHRDLGLERAPVPGRLKASLLGFYFRWTGVDGMVNPFGLDVIGNPDLLPFERPFVAAHEWAHLAGYAEESDASFVGFLTCVRSGVPEQYSGWLFLYWQVAGEVDGGARAELWDKMHPGPRADVEAVLARLRRGQLPRLRVLSWMVYDQYLKANRVEFGVRSYGEVVNLIARTRFDPDWVPLLR